MSRSRPPVDLPMLAQRMWNAPLAIHPGKVEIPMGVLAGRLGLAVNLAGAPLAFFDDDDDFLDDDDAGLDGRIEYTDAGYDRLGPIARINIRGTLVQRTGGLRPYCGMTGYNAIRQVHAAALADDKIEAIVHEIDSGGGEVTGLFDLVDDLFAARGDKPVWAILNESAYSAAYAIASAADRIVVPRTGGTGSIGVIAAHVDWSKALEKEGLKVTFIHYGARKTDGRPEIPLSDAALERLQADIDEMGELFIDTVARNRSLAAAKVRGFQAGTFQGAGGVTAGLADEVASVRQAYEALYQSLKD